MPTRSSFIQKRTIKTSAFADTSLGRDRLTIDLEADTPPSVELPSPNRFEQAAAAVDPVGRVLATAARQARRTQDPTGSDAAVEVGASVAGQAFAAFLLGARATCRTTGIDQVAFIARDGHLPYLMAKAMNHRLWEGIDLHYIHGNRLTWALAGARTLGLRAWIDMGSSDHAGYLVLGHRELSPRALLARLGLEPGDLPARHALASTPSDEPLGTRADAWLEFLDQITPGSALGQVVDKRAGERHRLAADYLSSVGLRQRPTLLLDVGWRGQSAIAASPIFTDVLGHEPTHYHFGGVGVQPSIDARGQIERYAFDDSVMPPPFPDMVCCVEMLTGNGAPRARRYEPDHTGITRPVFDGGVAEMVSSERDRIWSAAVATAAALPASLLRARFDRVAPDPTGIMEALRLLWQAPTPAQAALGARLKIEVDAVGQQVIPVAAPYSFRELRRSQQRRWREASALLSPTSARLAFAALSGAKAGLRRAGIR